MYKAAQENNAKIWKLALGLYDRYETSVQKREQYRQVNQQPPPPTIAQLTQLTEQDFSWIHKFYFFCCGLFCS
jgi:hypothetical protein